MDFLLSSYNFFKEFLTNNTYQTFWIAMAPIITFFGVLAIYVQIRHAVKSSDISILLSLRDRFWSDEMVKVRKKIKSKESIAWLVKLKNGDISADSVKVYSLDHSERFTIFDFFESIGVLYRKRKRLLSTIYPLISGDIIFHYKLHEHFYTNDRVMPLYPQQNFKYLAEACLKKKKKEKSKIPSFEELVENIYSKEGTEIFK